MKKQSVDDLLKDFTIVIDTREQTPWVFEGSKSDTINAGDYTVAINHNNRLIKYDKIFAVERKSAVSELYAATGENRERFENELEKLSKLEHKFVVCEFNMIDIENDVPPGVLLPSAVYGSIFSWHIKYGVPFLFCGNRVNARACAYKLIQFFVKYNIWGIK